MGPCGCGAVNPSRWSQDPEGGPETPEVESAPVSKAVTRAAMPKDMFTQFARKKKTLVVIAATVWESVWTQLSTMETDCNNGDICAGCAAISLGSSSHVLGRLLVFSQGQEQNRQENQNLKIMASANQAMKRAMHLQACERQP